MNFCSLKKEKSKPINSEEKAKDIPEIQWPYFITKAKGEVSFEYKDSKGNDGVFQRIIYTLGFGTSVLERIEVYEVEGDEWCAAFLPIRGAITGASKGKSALDALENLIRDTAMPSLQERCDKIVTNFYPKKP